MEEKNKDQKAEELVDVDEKGKAVQKTPEKKKASSDNFNHILIVFLLFVLLGLFLRIFVFNKNLEKNNEYHKFKTADDMNRNAGEAIVRFIHQHPKAKIGLASGTTPEGLYKYLIKKYERNEVSFKDVKFFSIDGFCGLPPSDKNSYAYSLTNSFLSKVDAKPENIFLLKEEGKNLEEFEKNAKDYNELLEKNPIDLQILSFGENGHIGFNEPGTDFQQLTHVIELTDEKRKDKSKIFGSIEKTPKYAISQGVASVLKSKQVIALAKGKGKADAVKNLVNGVFTEKYPITALINHSGKVTLYTDEEAGQYIREINKKF